MKNKDELVVYWANFGSLKKLQRTNLITEPPVRIMQTFHKEYSNPINNNSYKACSGAKNLYQNTFVIKNPFDVDAKILGQHPNAVVQEPLSLITLRDPTYQNAHSFDYDYYWVFFSEESVEMVLTPPYMHNTKASEYGIVASGSFDISKWLRNINACYNMHQGVNEFKADRGEPLFYVDFKTKKRVVLKQFDLTPDLHDLAFAAAELKTFFPFESLETLYDRFTRSNRHKKVMKEINKNLLD
jgi:hypothetical protein